MCRDERVCEDWKKDSLCHDTGTLEGMAGLLERGGWLNSLKSGVEVPLKRDTPIWVGHGTADQINAFEASQLFTQAVGLSDKTFKVYDGGFHKLHGEPGGIKEALAKDVAEWILERCGSPQ
jgi:acylglycerol lipase